MEHEDHIKTARYFLEASEQEFAGGDRLQASEKLWGAASHAVMAIAVYRDWPCRNHQSLRRVVHLLEEETQDDRLGDGFSIAEKFHRNFYHDEMEAEVVVSDRPRVRRFVDRMLALLENGASAG